MKGFESPYIYYCLGNFLFVTTCLICALIRWFHVCSEYKGHQDFYFPARKVVSIMFAVQIFQSFYWWDVFSDEAFFFAVLFETLIIPPFFVMMERRFFFFSLIKKEEVFRHFIIPVIILLLFLWATLSSEIDFSSYAIGARILATIYFIVEISLNLKWQIRIQKVLRNQFEMEYSDLNNFPKVFANRKKGITFCLSIILLIVLWANSRAIKLGVDLFLSIFAIRFVITILSAQRELLQSGAIEIKTHDVTDQRSTYLSETQRADLESRILDLLEREELFKQPHLSLEMLVRSLGHNRSYISETISLSSYGSFYKMVNHFRLEYAKQQLLNNPNIKIDQLAFDAGFSSRYMLTRSFKEFYDMTPTEWKKSN